MNGRRLLVASVISVQNSRFVYPSCQNCFSKLHLDLKRYSCLKCGCSGDSKEANYRYRLSLEVADTQSVFEVTVFGSCLDVYFGVTAKGLQRYIEKFYQEVREPDGDASPDVLFHAVETCFIGKKFVFGIKSYDKPESTSSQQNGCRTDRYPKTLTACQMFMPNSELIGNTVIHYLQQYQCSHFKQGHGGICRPDLFMAFDQPSSELSSLHESSGLAVVPSCSAGGLSVLWPQSFGLTSSPDSSGIAADPIDLNPSKSASTRQKEEDNPVSLSSQLIQNSWDHSLTKRNVEEDKRSHLYSGVRNCVAINSQPESDSTLGREDSRLLQSPIELEEKNLSSKMSIQNNYWLQKSCNHLLRQRQDTSLCFPASPSIHLPAGEDANSQETPWLWEELPSSESFNEFIAKIENDKAMVLPTKVPVHFPSDGADEFHGHFNQLSAKPGIFHVNLKTDQPGEKLQVLAEKAEQHNLNLLPSHSYQEAFCSSSSSKGKEKLGDLSHQPLHLLPSSSSVEVETHSEESCLKSEEGADQNVRISKNHHSKSSSKCLENSCLQTRNITACLNGKDDGNLFKWRGKGSPSNLNQTTDTTNTQEDSFASRTCKKSSGAGAKKGELLFQVDGCSFKRDNGSLLQNCSDSHEVSYNASADLFDSAREAEATVGKLNSAHILLAQENPMTKQCVTPGFMSEHSLADSLCELNGSCNTSSLCSMLITSDPKTNSPIAGLISGTECSLTSSLDFIPNSQSTPLARPCLQVRLPRGNGSILSELPLNKLSCVGAKCKRLWPALGSPSVRQLVSEFLQSRRLNDASDCQQLFTKGSPSQGLSEKDGEEWIPPSEKKQVQPLGIQNEKVLRKRRKLVRNNADCQAMGKSHLSESKVRCGISRSSVRLERVELSPKMPTEIIFGRQPMCKDDANYRQVMNGSPGSSIISDVRSNLSSTSCPVSNIPSWSPELFSDSCQLLSTDAVFSKPST